MSVQKFVKEISVLKKRIRDIEKSFEKLIYYEELPDERKMEDLIDNFKARCYLLLGDERFCEGEIILKKISEEMMAVVLGERTEILDYQKYLEELIKEEGEINNEIDLKSQINVCNVQQKGVFLMEKVYEEIEKIFGKKSVYEEKEVYSAVSIYECVERIRKEMNKQVERLLEVVQEIDKPIRRKREKIIKDGIEVDKDVVYVKCVECGKVLIERELGTESKEEFLKELSDHIEAVHYALRDRITGLTRRVIQLAEKGIKEEAMYKDQKQVVKEVYLLLMKQIGVFEESDTVKTARQKSLGGEKKYEWFKKENAFEVEEMVKELKEMVPEGSIGKFVKEIEKVKKYIKDNEKDKDILSIFKDGGN